MRDFTI
jgi:hypothetical protein